MKQRTEAVRTEGGSTMPTLVGIDYNTEWISAYMVSKAKDDFPLPLRPVMTTSFSRGIFTSIFFKLWALAP